MAKTHEVIVKIDGDEELYLFPSIVAGTVLSAQSVLNGSMRGKNLPFIKLHTGTDRFSPVVYRNVYHLKGYTTITVNVPKSILDLEPKEEDTEEEVAEKLAEIKAYFETT